MSIKHISDLKLETSYMVDNLTNSEKLGWDVLERLEKNPIIKDFEDFFLRLLKQNRVLAEIMFLSVHTEFNKEYVSENPFNKNVKMSQLPNSAVSVIEETYEKGQIFTCKSNSLIENGLLTYPLGYLSEAATVEALRIGDKTYSNSPSLIFNLETVVEDAKGKVLLFGLENGYLPYMWSLKENVSEIIIIEENADLVDYYNRVIDSQINQLGKITVLNKKTYDVLANRNYLKEFDFIFVNLWLEETSGLPIYLTFKEKQRDLPIHYWNEETFYTRAKILLLCYLAEEMEIFTFDIFKPFKTKISKLLKELSPELKKLHKADELFDFLFKRENLTRLLTIKA